MRRLIPPLILVLAACCFVPLAGDAASPHSTKVVCVHGFSGKSYRQRPHKCIFHDRNKPFAGNYMLATYHLRWRSWGGASAHAKGKVALNMVGPKRVKVSLTARRNVCGHTVYSKARFKYRVNGKSYHPRAKIDVCK